jgi:hypothetical protein
MQIVSKAKSFGRSSLSETGEKRRGIEAFTGMCLYFENGREYLVGKRGGEERLFASQGGLDGQKGGAWAT